MEPGKLSPVDTVLLCNALNKALTNGKCHITNLSQKERKTVSAALEQLKNINLSTPITNQNKINPELGEIFKHLEAEPKKPSFFKRIVKKIGNLLHIRISSKNLQSKINENRSIMSQLISNNVGNSELEIPQNISKANQTNKISDQKQINPFNEKMNAFIDQKKKLSEKVGDLQKTHEKLIDLRSQINDADKARVAAYEQMKEFEIKASDEKDVIKRQEYQQTSTKCRSTNTDLFNKMTSLKTNEETLKSHYEKESSQLKTEYDNLKKEVSELQIEIESLLKDEPDQEQLMAEKNTLETFLKNLSEESENYDLQLVNNLKEKERVNTQAKELLSDE